MTPSLDQDLYLTLTPAQRGEARRIISVGETVHKFWFLNNIMMRINPTILSVSLSPSQRQGDNYSIQMEYTLSFWPQHAAQQVCGVVPAHVVFARTVMHKEKKWKELHEWDSFSCMFQRLHTVST